MMKFAVLFVLVGAAAASSLVSSLSSQRNIIPHYSKLGYGNGVSARYFDKATTGLGLYSPLSYGGLGLGYNGLGLGSGRLGLGLGQLGLGHAGLGLGYGRLGGLGLGGLGYGLGGLGLGGLGYGRAGLLY